jgi:hypothetical protein
MEEIEKTCSMPGPGLPDDLPLPHRPQSHISESASGKIFRRAMSPDWIIRDVPPPDYGVDFELEWAPNNRVKGQKALIQLKGTTSIPWNQDNTFSFSG